MKRPPFFAAVLAVLLCVPTSVRGQDDAKTKTADQPALKILLVAGGCCHDYAAQSKILKTELEKRLDAEVTVAFSADTSTGTTFEIYESDKWADGFDVVIHDECSAAVTDRPYVDRILDAHLTGVPAVNLHCAMHSYRWGDYREPVEIGADNSRWYEMLGLQSTGHGPKFPIDVDYSASKHPITQGLENWQTYQDELYNNVRIFGGAEVLASGVQTQSPSPKELKRNPDAKPREATAVVAWTNLYGPKKTRVFSTTLGHFNETVADERYLDLVTRGILWTTGRLDSAGKEVAPAAAAK
ncbi:Trehalose utilization [Rubripirellula lacrimiformis]|uniref:Trehalose utilization n=1 Tax=Rubripirellula lacrimiformis TaxID=1930273 RepID=A0A517NDV2_9BACT|nr:ThuA domain-containing protein [Rubripirellula lacrimiformis]QDT05306.1 Trehalose utilization [Rubripirellula lacrimiformis]